MSVAVFTYFPDWNSNNFDMKNYMNLYANSNVIVHAHSSNVYYPKHNGTLTIKYVFKGEEFYITDRCRYRVNKNSFLVLNEQQNYESYIDSDEQVESLSLFFKPEFTHKVLINLAAPADKLLEEIEINKNTKQPLLFFEKLYRVDDAVLPVLQRIRNVLLSKSHDEFYLSEQMYFALHGLIYMHRNISKEIEMVSQLKRTTRVEIYKRLTLVKDYINSCYNENITLDLLAEKACMNSFHLLRTFKKVYGITPHHYLTETRLNEAKHLLETTSNSISEISALTGFEFHSSLTELFKRKFGISPRSFRKKVNFK